MAYTNIHFSLPFTEYLVTSWYFGLQLFPKETSLYNPFLKSPGQRHPRLSKITKDQTRSPKIRLGHPR